MPLKKSRKPLNHKKLALRHLSYCSLEELTEIQTDFINIKSNAVMCRVWSPTIRQMLSTKSIISNLKSKKGNKKGDILHIPIMREKHAP